jgi:hypothetical protein
LAFRYVNGQLRFFSSTNQSPSYSPGQIYEVSYPGCATSNYPSASVVKHWGNIYGGTLVDESGGGGTVYVYGLYWDETDQRLYWNYGDSYNVAAPDNPCFGYSTLGSSAVSYGPWRMGNCKPFQFGITGIPTSFANQYLRGNRLGIGFGGRASAESAGPVSDGPALAAISPPSSARLSEISSIIMLNYPCNPGAGDPYYCRRPAGYTDTITAAGHPRGPFGNYGGWQWMDFIFQGGVWIDMPSKHGFLNLPVLGTGAISYSSSTIHSGGIQNWAFIFDPSDLAKVAQGTKNSWDVIPSSYWNIAYPMYGATLGPQDDEPYTACQGACFDPTNNRLYVMIPWANGNYPMVCVYQVS